MKKTALFILFAMIVLVGAVGMQKETGAGAINFDGIDKDTVVLVTGSSRALCGSEEVFIDPNNPMVMPVIREDRAYVPQAFIEDIFGIQMDAARTVEINGARYVPLREILENNRREVHYENGVIVIYGEGASPQMPQAETVASLKNYLGGLASVGTMDKYKELMVTKPELITGRADTGMMIDVVEEASMDMAYDAAPADGSVEEQKVTAMEDAGSTSDGYSTTNVQVAGVDEGDIIKTDGKYIYYANGDNRLVVVSALPASSMQVLADIQYGPEDYIEEVYVDGDMLIVVLTGYERLYSPAAKSYYNSYATEHTKVFIYDMTNRSDIKEIREIMTEGHYFKSRKIGSEFYFLTKVQGYSLLNQNNDIRLPVYMDSAKGDMVGDISLDTMYYFPELDGGSITNIVGVQLENPESSVNIESYLGNGGEIYVTNGRLYMVTESYRYQSTRGGSYNRTNIYKFELDDGKVLYNGRGQVNGSILNQFSMDEHNGYFRIATTEFLNTGTRINNMYILDGKLNITGEITGIAPGENIYAVRFMGDKAYMVTFETVDPLFAMDLKDPYNPKILGELKIPGYSQYLHPYDENHLIGFGMDTVEEDGFAYMKGMKISLFDVSDLSQPKEKFTTFIGDRGTHSEILNNHRALLFSKERGIMAFPVNVYTLEIDDNDDEDDFFNYGAFTFQGAYVYDIHMDTGFHLKDSITHITGGSASIYDYNAYIQRIIYIGDNLYTVSNNIIKATNIESMTDVGSVSIK